MVYHPIGCGTSANDGTGDDLQNSAVKSTPTS